MQTGLHPTAEGTSSTVQPDFVDQPLSRTEPANPWHRPSRNHLAQPRYPRDAAPPHLRAMHPHAPGSHATRSAAPSGCYSLPAPLPTFRLDQAPPLRLPALAPHRCDSHASESDAASAAEPTACSRLPSLLQHNARRTPKPGPFFGPLETSSRSQLASTPHKRPTASLHLPTQAARSLRQNATSRLAFFIS